MLPVKFVEYTLSCNEHFCFVFFSHTNVLTLFRLHLGLFCICSPCAILNHGPMYISIVISWGGSSLASVKNRGEPAVRSGCLPGRGHPYVIVWALKAGNCLNVDNWPVFVILGWQWCSG